MLWVLHNSSQATHEINIETGYRSDICCFTEGARLVLQEVLQFLLAEGPVADLALVLLHSRLLEVHNVDAEGGDAGSLGAGVLVLPLLLCHRVHERAVFHILQAGQST